MSTRSKHIRDSEPEAQARMITGAPRAAAPIYEKRPPKMSSLRFKWTLGCTQDDQLLYAGSTDDGRGRRIKAVSPEAVAAAFSTQPLLSPWLAPQTVRYGWSTRGEVEIQFWPPERRRVLCAEDALFDAWEADDAGAALDVTCSGWGRADGVVWFDLPLPALVWCCAGPTAFVFASDRSAFAPDLALFHAPLPNVYADGRVCWGQNRLTHESGAALASRAYIVFRDAVFTASEVAGKSRAEPEDVRRFWTSLCGAERYPVHDLVPSDVTLEHLVERVFGELLDAPVGRRRAGHGGGR